ncbi:helix-turn-helix domain-containing protein [uncultured Devosia sp.]|uniref:helix-turn-helix domain-containing protein n=1 Tax=uncultured Devosia sp. TaxID=211434 RepID=UPI0035CBB150
MVGVMGAREGAFGRATFFAIREPVAGHAHPFMHLLFKTGGGDRRLLIEGQERVLSDAQSLLINPWQRHSDDPIQAEQPTTMLALYIERAWMDKRFGPAVGFAQNLGLADAPVRGLVQQVSGAICEPSGLDAVAFEAVIADLIEAASSAVLVNRGAQEMCDFRIRRARRQLEAHPHLHIDLGGVARAAGLSRSHFYEQFRSGIGVAPHMFMDALVLEQAYRMMHSRQSLDDIAKSLGFAAQSSFSRFFKDRVGFPPSTIRRQIGQRVRRD